VGDFLATPRAIINPYGGHGYDVMNELYCHNAEFSINLANTENNTLPTINQYQQVGLLRNPLFDAVKFTFLSSSGQFTSGETIYFINPIQMAYNASITANSTVISSNSANFVNQFANGQSILVSTSDGLKYQYCTINTVVNTSIINVSSNITFSCTATIIYNAQPFGNCMVTSVLDTYNVFVTNCPPVIGTQAMMIGNQTGSYAVLNTITRNGVVKQFDTFIELYKYSATLVSNTFLINEVVKQGNSSGYVHHVEGTPPNISIFLSGMTQIFNIGQNITGNSSGAIATLTTQFNPEVLFGSGQVQYLENIPAVTRSNTQTETYQIIVSY
jgi:hypothetical protein